MTVTIAPWGAIVLATEAPFAADSLLDLWVRGSGIMSVSIFFEDTAGHRLSRCGAAAGTPARGWDGVHVRALKNYCTSRLAVSTNCRTPPH